MDLLKISDAIEQFDLAVLTQDIFDLLLLIMPTDAVFNQDVLKDLAICDQFILIISGIIEYKERIKTIMFKYMLALGNYMNGGSFRRGAFGYTLAFLVKFNDTKSNGYTSID